RGRSGPQPEAHDAGREAEAAGGNGLMPPRYAYWTILVGDSPTAFRAARAEELRPTFERLREKHPDVVMKWFARGRLWSSPAEAQQPSPRRERPAETRGRDWRPGGEHRDPRERFKKPRGPHPARAKKQWPREGPPRPA